jgi:hypothetical protein
MNPAVLVEPAAAAMLVLLLASFKLDESLL